MDSLFPVQSKDVSGDEKVFMKVSWKIPQKSTDRERNLERRHHGCRHRGPGKIRRVGNPSGKAQCKRNNDAESGVNVRILDRIWNSTTIWKESMESENPLHGGTNLQGVKISERSFKGTRRSQQTETRHVSEARNDFRSSEGDFNYRHHDEPRRIIPNPTEIH